MRWFGRYATTSVIRRNRTVRMATGINARLNYGGSSAKILRHKLRDFYFQGKFDLQPFVDMDVKLMPCVLELVTRTEELVGVDQFGRGKYYEVCSEHLDPIYRLVRNCHLPELFSFPSLKIRKLEANTQEWKGSPKSLRQKLLRWKRASQKKMIGDPTMENDELRSATSSLPRKRKK